MLMVLSARMFSRAGITSDKVPDAVVVDVSGEGVFDLRGGVVLPVVGNGGGWIVCLGLDSGSE